MVLTARTHVLSRIGVSACDVEGVLGSIIGLLHAQGVTWTAKVDAVLVLDLA